MEFELIPASPTALTMLGAISAFCAALTLMFACATWSASHGSVTITDRAIQVNVFPYRRAIPIANIDAANARVLNPDETSGIRGAWRTNGIGLPGYAVGWFRLAGGGRALVAVTKGRLLFGPTSEGYSLIVSVAHPDVALKQLRAARGG